jgi:hypothetical protein
LRATYCFFWRRLVIRSTYSLHWLLMSIISQSRVKPKQWKVVHNIICFSVFVSFSPNNILWYLVCDVDKYNLCNTFVCIHSIIFFTHTVCISLSLTHTHTHTQTQCNDAASKSIDKSFERYICSKGRRPVLFFIEDINQRHAKRRMKTVWLWKFKAI